VHGPMARANQFSSLFQAVISVYGLADSGVARSVIHIL